jgi:hypothetical protein
VEELSGEKPSEQPQSKPKPKLVRFRCGYCGKEGHKDEFCFKRKQEQRMAKEWANKDRYNPSHGVPKSRMPLPRGKAVVRSRSFEKETRDGPRVVFRGFGPPLGSEGWFPRSGYRGGVRGGSYGRKDGLMCANPTFQQMARHWFYSFGTNPSAESFVRSRAHF